MTLPDPSNLRAQFERFYKTRMEILTLMSHDFRHNTTKFQAVANFVKNLFLENKYAILGVLFFAYLLRRYYQDKKVFIFCKKTERNIKILKFLDKIIASYKPTFFLPGPFAKIVYVDLKTSPEDQHYYLRYEHTLCDGEVIALDFYPKNHDILSRTTPTIVLFPGVFGDSLQGYCFELIKQVREKLRWRVCIVHRRGYGGMPIRGEMISSFARHEETHDVLQAIQRNFPDSNLYAIGVSLGAQAVQRYLIEYGSQALTKGALTIGSPWNAHATAERLNNNKLCNYFMMNDYRQRMKSHMHEPNFLQITKNRGLSEGTLLLGLVNQSRTFVEL